MRNLCLLFAATLVLSGCQTCPSMRASWYEHEEYGQGQSRVMTLAVLNAGQAPFWPDSLTLNPLDEQGRGGWTLKLKSTLEPGELRVLRVVDFKDVQGKPFPGCRIPVRVAMQCAGGTRLGWAQLDGVLPNLLPQQWIDNCKEPKEMKEMKAPSP